ncbi:MAG: hypothetical protein HFJ07_10330 [Lachnospiraceae bacterium]|nr:hypothetical protein [Lachnospiraceae bacterium]
MYCYLYHCYLYRCHLYRCYLYRCYLYRCYLYHCYLYRCYLHQSLSDCHSRRLLLDCCQYLHFPAYSIRCLQLYYLFYLHLPRL